MEILERAIVVAAMADLMYPLQMQRRPMPPLLTSPNISAAVIIARTLEKRDSGS